MSIRGARPGQEWAAENDTGPQGEGGSRSSSLAAVSESAPVESPGRRSDARGRDVSAKRTGTGSFGTHVANHEGPANEDRLRLSPHGLSPSPGGTDETGPQWYARGGRGRSALQSDQGPSGEQSRRRRDVGEASTRGAAVSTGRPAPTPVLAERGRVRRARKSLATPPHLSVGRCRSDRAAPRADTGGLGCRCRGRRLEGATRISEGKEDRVRKTREGGFGGRLSTLGRGH